MTADRGNVTQDRRRTADLPQFPQPVAQHDDDHQQHPISATMNNMDALIGGLVDLA